MRTAIAAGIALAVGILFLPTGTVAASAPLRAPSGAVQKTFVTAVRADGPTKRLSNKSLVALGEGVCSLLRVHSVSDTVTTVAGAGTAFLPPRFVKTLMKESPVYFCPQYVSKVKKGGSLVPPAAIVALAPLVSTDATNCSVVGKSGQPDGLVGVTAAIACEVPDLGSTSSAEPCPSFCNSVFAYEFDNAGDSATSLVAFNTSKGFVPSNPPVTCPTTNTDAIGTQPWGNSVYPQRSGQILECLTVDTTSGGPNNVPNYLWTLPTKNAIFDAFGNPGMSMQTLDTWWQNHSAPGP
ncbi:MAG TPA: hypothetical protein VHZ02_00790 [Acidimicrobiales bacterium]|jgi:hypothetical protein|nr:hypothetical protein [Acidimicrobiales bacterium]